MSYGYVQNGKLYSPDIGGRSTSNEPNQGDVLNAELQRQRDIDEASRLPASFAPAASAPAAPDPRSFSYDAPAGAEDPNTAIGKERQRFAAGGVGQNETYRLLGGPRQKLGA